LITSVLHLFAYIAYVLFAQKALERALSLHSFKILKQQKIKGDILNYKRKHSNTTSLLTSVHDVMFNRKN